MLREAWHVVEKSEDTDETASTVASVSAPVDPELVANLAAEDKEVRRLQKKLRDITKLIERSVKGERLDALQDAKVAGKDELEQQLEDARVLARARARWQLRSQAEA